MNFRMCHTGHASKLTGEWGLSLTLQSSICIAGATECVTSRTPNQKHIRRRCCDQLAEGLCGGRGHALLGIPSRILLALLQLQEVAFHPPSKRVLLQSKRGEGILN